MGHRAPLRWCSPVACCRYADRRGGRCRSTAASQAIDSASCPRSAMPAAAKASRHAAASCGQRKPAAKGERRETAGLNCCGWKITPATPLPYRRRALADTSPRRTRFITPQAIPRATRGSPAKPVDRASAYTSRASSSSSPGRTARSTSCGACSATRRRHDGRSSANAACAASNPQASAATAAVANGPARPLPRPHP